MVTDAPVCGLVPAGWLAGRLRQLDASAVLFALLGLILVGLVVLPMAALVEVSLRDDDGAPSLANFIALVTDESLVAPFLLSLFIATAVSADNGCRH